MNERDFCIWLSGYLDITNAYDDKLSLLPEQIAVIKKRLEPILNNISLQGTHFAQINEPIEPIEPMNKDFHWAECGTDNANPIILNISDNNLTNRQQGKI